MKAIKSNKLDYINAVRGIAILMVIVLHVSLSVKGLPDTFTYMCGKGAYGVQLFFVASAFTLFLSYFSRIKIEAENAKHNFFIRRFFRISPMYYLAALFYAIVCYYIPAYNDGKPLVAWKVLMNVLYLNGFVPGAVNYLPPGGWSVGVEMVFYCCVPFLFSKIKDFKTSVRWFWVLFIGSFLLKLLIRYLLIKMSVDYHRPENWFLYFWFPNQIPVFVLGIVLFFAINKFVIKDAKSVYLGSFITSLVLLIFTYFKRDMDPYLIIPEHVIVALLFTINIYFLSQHPIKIFDNKITRYFGELSFSLYLIHFMVIYVLADYVHLSNNPFVQFFILLVLTLIISTILAKITYKIIEVPGIKLGKKYIRSNSSNIVGDVKQQLS